MIEVELRLAAKAPHSRTGRTALVFEVPGDAPPGRTLGPALHLSMSVRKEEAEVHEVGRRYRLLLVPAPEPDDAG